MAPAFAAFMQIMSFLVENRDTIKQIIVNIEGLIPTASGIEKAASVKAFIGTTLGIEAQVEAAWPMVLPFFNLFVSSVKSVIHPVQ